MSSCPRIAFGHQIFSLQRYGGISRYFVNLIDELATSELDVAVFAPRHLSGHLSTLAPDLVKGSPSRRTEPSKGQFALSHALASAQMRSWRPDIIHPTYYHGFPRWTGNARTVITVHDMIHEVYPEMFPGSREPQRKSLAVRSADHVIAVSENTRQDLIRLTGIDPEKVTTVHHGAPILPAPRKGVVPKGDRPYLLFVGNRWHYKNFVGMLEAIGTSKRLKSDFDIVAFGGGALSDNEIQLAASLGFRDGALRQTSGDDSVCAALYQQATAFIYPSLYEGFGFPPLEAMQFDCPVVSSNTSSMPEVLGNSVSYFDPLDSEAMRDAIESVVYSTERSDELVRAGRERTSSFTWSRCAAETLKIYEQIRA